MLSVHLCRNCVVYCSALIFLFMMHLLTGYQQYSIEELTLMMFSNTKAHLFTTANDNILSLRNIFKPLYVVLSFFGLFPYSVKFTKKHGLKIIPKSIYLNSVCAVSYILFMLSFLILHFRYVYEALGDTSMTREMMTQMNYLLELIVSFVAVLSAYICVYKNRIIFVNTINYIANIIEPPNTETECILKRFRFRVNVIILGFLLIVLLLQTCINFTRDDEFWKKLLVFVTFILPQQIQFTVLCFYYWLIQVLVILLMNIRGKISDLTRDKTNLIEYCTKANVKILTLQYVEKLYVKALGSKKEIVQVFEALLLITAIQCFHSIISEAHIIYHGLVMEKDFSLHPLINCSVWIIYQIIKIFILARSGTLLKREILKIGQTLHDIPVERHDIRLLLEVQHFATLMAQQNSEITAYGLFKLDATLISKIISSSAMYLIILVQFDRK